MYEQVERSKENKSRGVANTVAQKKSGVKQGFGFVDNRPEAIAQRKILTLANTPSQIIQKNEDIAELSNNPQFEIKENNLITASHMTIQRMDDGNGEYQVDSDNESEEDDGLIAVNDPYVLEALEILSGNNNGLATFVSTQMKIGVNDVDDRLTTAISQGLQNWGQNHGVRSAGFFGITNLTDGDGSLAQKTGEGNWRINPTKIPEVKHVISGAMWTGLRTHFDEEVGGQLGMNLLSPEVDVKGVKLRFTARVDDSNRVKVATKVRQFYDEILGANIRKLAEQVFRNQTSLKGQALNVWKETTGADPTNQEMTEAKRAIFKKKTNKKKLLEFLNAAQIGMKDALTSGRIKLVIDRANNKLAFGGASAANDTNAQQLMDMEINQNIVNDHMVRVNLDATGLSGLKTTLAHEVGHVAGFNPTGMAASGHMQNVEDYIANEPETGLPKIMVDAYFFEMIYTRFLKKG